jgi:hypothetical protein
VGRRKRSVTSSSFLVKLIHIVHTIRIGRSGLLLKQFSVVCLTDPACCLALSLVSPGVHYTGTRYMQLAEMLNKWGYEVTPHPDFSGWNEIVAASPLTGFVLLRGEKTIEDLTLVFNIREFWVEGIKSDRLVREGASLVRYHYHGQSDQGGMRFCLYEEGHPAMPFHRHPFGHNTRAEHSDPIDVEDALDEFETAIFLMAGGDQD